MSHYSQAAVERTRKAQEVIRRAMNKESKWYQAVVANATAKPPRNNRSSLLVKLPHQLSLHFELR